MIFNEKLVEILQNFSTINPSIAFKPGNIVATMKPTKAVIAKAKVDVEFTSGFAIYELGKLLSLLSAFDKPEVTILDNHMTIEAEGAGTVTYVFCDPSLIVVAPDKEIRLSPDQVDVEFKVDAATLKRVGRLAATIGSPEIAVTGNGESIFLEAINSKNTADNTYRMAVGKTSKRFKMIFLVENITLLERDYEIRISSRGLAHFSAEDVEYWIAVEQHSKYEG